MSHWAYSYEYAIVRIFESGFFKITVLAVMEMYQLDLPL